MDLQQTNMKPPAARPRWQRVLALLIAELVILQPGLAAAQVAQVPMFTVTSVPPNVMLLFDDSASMQLLSLKSPPYYSAPTNPRTHGGNPLLKLNTQGYYGISGISWYTGLGATDDNKWTFLRSEVLQRSAAFNPLAYNPAVQYKPWNSNGTAYPNAAYGGSSNVPTASRTPWDPRSFPDYMKFTTSNVTVRSKTPGTNTGLLHQNSVLRSWGADAQVKAGSVRYDGLISSTAGAEAWNVDIFTGTIAWNNPDCGTPVVTQNYGWTCTSGSAWSSPAETCNVGNVNTDAATRTCCTSTSSSSTTTFTSGFIYDQWFTNVPGSPPAMTGPGGETCTTIAPRGDTWLQTGLAPCTTTTAAPYVAPCGGGGGELCTFTPAPVTTCTGTQLWYAWRCTYGKNVTTTTTTCNTQIPQRCINTGSTSTCPYGQPLTTSSNAQYTSGYWTPARYAVYDGPQPGTQAERNNLNNYRMILIDRKFGWNGGTSSRDLIGTNLSDAVSKWFVVDAVTGLPGYRPDCAVNAGQDGTWCTFDQEAQNYANWFTYYRNRLFAAIGTMSEVLSGFTGPEQSMRIGFGRINYFKNSLNPWNVGSVTDLQNTGGLPAIESGVPNEGAVERGVRPFTPIGSTDRTDVFKWLFSMNAVGPTPNREALHAAGQYFANSDSKGPWGLNPGSGSEASSDHLWCRRNFTVLATDGEWTKLDPVLGFEPQRLLERASDWTVDPIAQGVTTSMSVDGLAIAGTERLTGAARSFQYQVLTEPQITGGSGSTQTGTLTDVMHYYWSHDLRSDLRNSLDPTPNNRAFWQHMSSYVVGYGVTASMDDPSLSPSLRATFLARNTIAWPTVGLEACRQLDDNAQDATLNPQRPTPCVYTVTPSGNRINDTLRAALSSAGDFFSANSPSQLRASLDAVFSAINAENAAGTSPSFSNSTLSAGSLFVQSGFFTNTWEGYVKAYDAKAYLDFLGGTGSEPPPVWSINFPAPASRNIFTSSDQTTPVAFDWCNLSSAQQSILDPVYASANTCPTAAPAILPYLRGDATNERRNGGTFRDRRNTILGDVVNSTPVYSKANDLAYQLSPAASYSASGTQGYSEYRNYVQSKKTTRLETVMFGANDGMFHMLDARTAQVSSGREIFAYVPRAAYSRLRPLSDPAYVHRYSVDGPVIEGDVWNGTVWKTIAIGTMGAGPAGIFAIDITSPESGMSATNVLWDITDADHPDSEVRNNLGRTIGAGVIGSVRYDADGNSATQPNGKWAYIVGNGYDSSSKRAALIVLNALDGSLIRVIDTGVGSGGSPNGIGAVTPIYDGNRNIVAVYAGDKLGNLWKFDLSSSDPSNWKIFNEQPAGTSKPLFTATSGGMTRPIHQAPRITQHPLGGLYVTFGTGKYFDVGDPGNAEDQGIFAIWDKGQLAPIAFGAVEQIQTEEYTSGSETFRRLYTPDLANFDWNDKGFWVRLRPRLTSSNGERVIAPLILDGGMLVVSTFAPENGTDPCIPGGSSYLYRIDLAGGFTQGAFGAEGATTIGRRVNPGTVGGLVPVYQPVDPGPTVVDAMDASAVTTMLSNPKYRMSGNRPVQQGATGTCVHAGLRVDGTVARIPTNCAGLMPLRSWRPMR
ncbi:MAG: PilC/PilY family type IV pilus protein [Burkholderiaceae bacterium]